MTAEEKDRFIKVMAEGCFCGLAHPFECMVNHERSLAIICKDELELDEHATKLRRVFLAFWKESDPSCASLDENGFDALVCAWFKRRDEQKQKWLESQIRNGGIRNAISTAAPRVQDPG